MASLPRLVDRRLVRHAAAARGYLTVTVALGLAATGLILAQAGLLARALAGAATGVGVTALRGPLIALGLVLLARAAVSYGGEVAALRAAATVKSQLRRGLIGHALALGPAWLGGGPGPREGELATLATRGLDGLDAYFARYLPQLVLAVLVPVAVLARVAAADWLSALIIAVTLPLVPVFAVLTGLHTRARTQQAEIRRLTRACGAATMGTLRIAFLSALVLDLAASLATALVAVEVGLRLLAGHLGYQTALLVLLLTPEAFLPLRNAGAQFHASIEGVTAAASALEVLETPLAAGHAVGPGGGPVVRPDLRRHTITLTGVGLRYPGRPEPALDGLDLEIRPGDHLTVTGPSGAGKSSLLALLLRFAAPTEGTIELSGPGLAAAGLAGVPAAAWRAQLAWVPQRTHLFDDTVAGNIALGRPGASPDDIRHAAALAGADGFITALDEGYLTPVGERGHRLSAGQRQKIAIARAFLRDAPLLLLDEPAAHLDPFSAAAVQDALAALVAGRTVVHVTHFPSETDGRRLALYRGRPVAATAGLGEPTGAPA
jgi:ATP-binding cassette subfamily C protein CydD